MKHPKQNLGLITQICKEPKCRKQFINNGRNAQKHKEFCSCYCSSKYSNRVYRGKTI